MALSRERIAAELLALLALADPAPTIALMQQHAIFAPVAPEPSREPSTRHADRARDRASRRTRSAAAARRAVAARPRACRNHRQPAAAVKAQRNG